MDVAVIGGTGAEGFGLAIRLARARHHVTIGSRDAGRGAESASKASELAGSTVEGTEDAEQQVALPAGARLVLSTADTSPLGLWGGKVNVELSGDTDGSTEIDAGEVIVLADASDGDRTIGVSVDVDGPAHWTLAVEVAR